MTRNLGLPLMALLCVYSHPSAQELHPLLRAGDPLNGRPVEHVVSSAVDDQGGWLSIAETRRVLTIDLGGVLVDDGTPLTTEGFYLSSIGARVFHFESVLGTSEHLSLLARLDEFTPPRAIDPYVLLHDFQPILLQGEPVNVPGASPQPTCRLIETLAANAAGTVLAVASLDGGAPDRGLLRFVHSHPSPFFPVTRELVVRTGDALPDGSVVTGIPPLERTVALNESGEWLLRVQASDGREHLLSGSGPRLSTGTPAPVPGRRIEALGPAFDLSDLGAVAVAVRLDGDPASDRALLRSGALFAREGEVFPSLSPLLPDLVVRDIGKVSLANSGSVYWQLLTDGGRRVGAFMRDREVVVQAGASVVAGELVTEFANAVDNFDVSPSGRFWVGRVELQVSGDALVAADFGASRPLPGCAPNPATLRHTDGLVLAGSTIELTLDGPAPLGAAGRVTFALGAAPTGTACGIPTPFGELFLAPGTAIGSVPAGMFFGGPVALSLAIPPSAALVDVELVAQGAFLTGGAPLLTNGLALEIGAP